jgi:hypothetical protein
LSESIRFGSVRFGSNLLQLNLSIRFLFFFYFFLYFISIQVKVESDLNIQTQDENHLLNKPTSISPYIVESISMHSESIRSLNLNSNNSNNNTRNSSEMNCKGSGRRQDQAKKPSATRVSSMNSKSSLNDGAVIGACCDNELTNSSLYETPLHSEPMSEKSNNQYMDEEQDCKNFLLSSQHQQQQQASPTSSTASSPLSNSANNLNLSSSFNTSPSALNANGQLMININDSSQTICSVCGDKATG